MNIIASTSSYFLFTFRRDFEGNFFPRCLRWKDVPEKTVLIWRVFHWNKQKRSKKTVFKDSSIKLQYHQSFILKLIVMVVLLMKSIKIHFQPAYVVYKTLLWINYDRLQNGKKKDEPQTTENQKYKMLSNLCLRNLLFNFGLCWCLSNFSKLVRQNVPNFWWKWFLAFVTSKERNQWSTWAKRRTVKKDIFGSIFYSDLVELLRQSLTAWCLC